MGVKADVCDMLLVRRRILEVLGGGAGGARGKVPGGEDGRGGQGAEVVVDRAEGFLRRVVAERDDEVEQLGWQAIHGCLMEPSRLRGRGMVFAREVVLAGPAQGVRIGVEDR